MSDQLEKRRKAADARSALIDALLNLEPGDVEDAIRQVFVDLLDVVSQDYLEDRVSTALRAFDGVTPAILEYRKLQDGLAEIRRRNRGHDSAEEGVHLHKMDRVWWDVMSQADRDSVSRAASRRYIAPGGGRTEPIIADVDTAAHPGSAPRRSV